MFVEDIKSCLDKLEKEHNYSPSFYKVVKEWLVNNSLLHDDRDLDTLLEDLDVTLSELYKYKKSLKIVQQREIEKKVLDKLENHLEIEVAEPEVTLKF